MAKQEFSYDRLAKHYDFLSHLVFFKSQSKAQTEQLHFIKNCERLLIVGGGTAWILNDLNTFKVPKHITFVESSTEMIALAKKINTHHVLEFVHEDVAQYDAETKFDAVLTAFLFDNFNEQKAEAVFRRIAELLTPSALWLYTDFKLGGKWWQTVLLKSMHWFFRLLKVVKTNSLPNMEHSFNTKNFELMLQKSYYGGFIEARVYRKSG